MYVPGVVSSTENNWGDETTTENQESGSVRSYVFLKKFKKNYGYMNALLT